MEENERTRSGTPPAAAGLPGPWSYEAEVELRRKAEYDRDHWKAKAGKLTESLKKRRPLL